MNSSNDSDVYFCDILKQFTEVTTIEVILAVVTALLMPGNIILLLISLKSAYSPNRVYVAALAIVDFAVCLLYIYATVASAFAQAYPNLLQPPQMMLEVGMEIANNLTLTLLVVIAFDRYVAVCHPGRPQLTKPQVTRILLGTIICGLLLALLCRVLILRGHWNLAGIFFCVEWASTILFMSVCYGRLSWALYRRLKMKKKLGVAPTGASLKPNAMQKTDSSAQSGQLKTTFPPGGVCSCHPASAKLNDSASTSTCTAHERTMTEKDTEKDVHELTKVERRVVNNINRLSRTAHLVRTSTMLFLVTFLFFVCWSPFMFTINGVDMPCDLGFCFVLNSVVNPLVFIGLSKQYRGDALKVLNTCQKL